MLAIRDFAGAFEAIQPLVSAISHAIIIYKGRRSSK
jgi:hypothetical protein